MSWNTLPFPKTSVRGYRGIHVGYRTINFPKCMVRELNDRGWDYVQIEYDTVMQMIRFTKAERNKGYGITKHRTITAHLTKIMPTGRYMCTKEGEGEMVFTKETN